VWGDGMNLGNEVGYAGNRPLVVGDPLGLQGEYQPDIYQVAILNPYDAFVAYVTSRVAETASERQGFPSGRQDPNGAEDAFRHTLGAMLLAWHIGPGEATKFLDAHECKWNNPELSKEMDYRNNRLGLRLAAEAVAARGRSLTEQECVVIVREAYEDGLMVLVVDGHLVRSNGHYGPLEAPPIIPPNPPRPVSQPLSHGGR
jgi:hypothetical protein